MSRPKEPESKITIADVARAAGVSPMTVSRVLNDRGGASAETSQRIILAASELNYRPNPFARGLRSDRSRAIGLLVPDITNPFFPEVIRGAEDAASAAGYNLLLSNVVENSKREEELIETLLRHRVDGIIVCSPRLPDAALHKALAPHRAVVLINREAPNEVAGTIVTDYETGASRAIDHLVERGRRRIAIIAGPRSSFGGKSRLVGFRKTLSAHGLKAQGIVYCDPTAAGGQTAAAQLLAEAPGIDALVCYNDLNAIGAMKACRAAGISIPGEIALIGFDDIPTAELLSPALTTLRVQKREMGEEAVRLLLSRIATRNRQHGIVIVPELIIRETT
ncbi:transcriptional regulator (plasmid) [Rhizobium leguminosarum bv. trifolii WSM1689]|nr:MULTISPECIES: LacI family DNA-binding transcriptional regulator [Rhizobium]AHF88357.1 transcriptional regulator [Rhizobium leguminosarum bv. trifolii WSM1689]MBY3156035.1 LacI family transcriptional regulator [Rhizobium laguerreae]MBY5740476.1 LacI family transcriptional regulator [Rhizobium leguminosarum]